MTYHKVILHLTLFFSTVIFGYSENPIICNKKSTFVAEITHAQHIAITTAWNNWYYSNGGSVFRSWGSSGGNYNNSLPSYPTSVRRYNPPAINYIRYAPRPNCRVSVSRNKLRTFTSTDGGKFEGRLLSINATNKTARIRTEKGLSYNISLSRFCSSDISYLKSWWYERNPPKQLTGYKAFLAKKRNG